MERIRTLAAERVNEAIRTDPVKRYGRVVRSSGDVLRASGIRAPIGARCLIDTEGGQAIAAEVVGFEEGSLLIMPEQGTRGVVRGARVHAENRAPAPLMGPAHFGRVIDGRGLPLDSKVPPNVAHPWPLMGVPINPMLR